MSWGQRIVVTSTVGVMLAVSAGCAAPAEQTFQSPTRAPATSAPVPTTPTTPTSTTPPTTSTTTTVAGQPAPCEFRCPSAGDVFAVVGVEFDVGLPLRAGPADGEAIVATLASTATVTATGVNAAFSAEVTSGGATGWADRKWLAALARENDDTARVIALLGARPQASSILQLGRTVADTYVFLFDNRASAVSVTGAPTEGVVGEVTYDVIGFPDDSVQGVRLAITGRQVEGAALPPTGFARALTWELASVTATDICARGTGIRPTGLCP